MKFFMMLVCVSLLVISPEAFGDFSPTGTKMSVNSEEPPTLEPIAGSQNFRINDKKGKDEKRWFDGRDLRHIHCVRPGKCERLKNATCFGSRLPYQLTSLDLTDAMHQEETRERLYNYEALRNIPKCWAVIQPFLCAVFVPKCENITNRDMVYLPSLEMCRITLEPCRILYNTTFFPEFLKCNETLFPSKCNNDVREMKFNATGQCLAPLIATDSASSYYTDIEGCGVQCKDPLYTDDEHRQIYKLTAWCACICLLCNLFAIATFFIDWKNANKYPALIIFYINFCFLVNCFGWLLQFTPGSREDIVCRKDGTLRHSEPSAGENLSCIVVFVLVYYSLIAVMVWFVILTYSWHLRAIGNVQDRIDKKGSYFHLIAWSLPLVLTITIMALSEVDGNSIAGICFVGYVNHPMRAGFLLGPLAGVLLIGGFFIVRGMIMLFELKNFANEIKSSSASNKIHVIIVRMGLSTMFAFVFIVVAAACQMFEFRNSQQWADSLRELIICKISATYNDVHQNCKLDRRPSVAVLQLQLLCLFGSGIVMSSWCWTRSSIDTWKRYIKKKSGHEMNDDIKIQKHKVIAQTWAKRKEFQDKGRLSISFYESHTDPAGLNFDVNDLNSVATNEMSSTWFNYLPNITRRRFALTGVTTNSSSCGPRKSSVDSEISVSVRQFSMESRRTSMDSQVSVKIAEVETKVARRTHGHSHIKSKGRNRRFNRRESSTSVESQIITSNYPSHKVGFFSRRDKRMKRRSANAGLGDAEDINTLITNFPEFTRNFQGMTTTSDDDNNSRASLKIQDHRLDVVVRQGGGDDEEITASTQQHNRKHVQTGDVGRHHQIYPSLQDVLGNQAAFSSLAAVTAAGCVDNNLRSSREGSRASKNSQKSVRSRKSSKHHSLKRNRNNSKSTMAAAAAAAARTSGRREKGASTQTAVSMATSIADGISLDDSSFTSYSSEMELPLNAICGANGGIQSSYSGMSVGKNSRSSKTSCDVGTQANAYEIATQTMSFEENNDNLMKAIKAARTGTSRMSDDDDDDQYTENHKLLTMPSMVQAQHHMSETTREHAEKVKSLLLPRLLPSK